jgi:membrane associated rhomboid family serine protease
VNASLEPSPEVFRFRAGRGEIALHASGLRHPGGFLQRAEVFTPYADVTHVVLSRRSLRLATRRSVYAWRRSIFRDAAESERLAQALLARIAAEPGGAEQLARMRWLEQRVRRQGRPRLTALLLAACLFAHAIQVLIGPVPSMLGGFNAELVRGGELWRVVTANLLHAWPGFPAHLVLNLVGLLVLGALVERALGSVRTLLVAAGAVVGSAIGCTLAGYESAVGASGVLFGFVGAAICMELRQPELLPAWWRIPRRVLLWALGVDLVLGALLPMVAGAAHLGGLLGGLVLASFVAEPGLRRSPLRFASLATAAALAAAAVVAVGQATSAVLGSGPALERYERRLVSGGFSPFLLNNYAWLVAVAPLRLPAHLEMALRLAEQAVRDTARADPNLLDTLAEVQFVAGHSEEALDTIEEAIALAPGETYFREQRRRFSGERARGDRPDPPAEPPFAPRLPPGHPPLPGGEEPGIPI